MTIGCGVSVYCVLRIATLQFWTFSNYIGFEPDDQHYYTLVHYQRYIMDFISTATGMQEAQRDMFSLSWPWRSDT